MVEGKEELEQQHSRQTDNLHKGMAVIKHKEFFVLTEVGGMVDHQKQGQQRRLDQHELIGAYTLDSR